MPAGFPRPFFKPVPGLPTKLIHCAGVISIGSRFQKRLFDVNVEGTRNILACCKDFAVSKLVHVSSVHAIPEQPDGQVISEIDHFDPGQVVGYYAKSKAQASQLVLDAAKEGLDASIVHPSGICGPNDYGRGHISQLFKDYCNGALAAIVKGGYDFVMCGMWPRVSWLARKKAGQANAISSPGTIIPSRKW